MRHRFTSESAKRARAKVEANRHGHLAASQRLSVSVALAPTPPFIQDAAKGLIPRILADEIAFRSELLASVQRLEGILCTALREKEYDPSKSSLPALIREHRETVKLSLSILESAKGVTIPGNARGSQVSGLIAREGLLRKALQQRGLMDERGELTIRRPERDVVDVSEAEPSSESAREGEGVS